MLLGFRLSTDLLAAASILATGALAISSRISTVPNGVPSFVIEYDPFRPADIGAQVKNTQPKINLTKVDDAPSSLTLENLQRLNSIAESAGGSNVYLASKDYIDLPDHIPAWLKGVTPDSRGSTPNTTACAIIVSAHSDNSTVDVFYAYFYAYNYGGEVVGVNLDDHVGDWEHNMIRFVDGKPTAIWFSQHSNGQAFTYDALSKSGQRPYVYSANGSHANYAVSGTHDHTLQIINLPDGKDFLEDYTDNGPLWDPTLDAFYYSFDAATNTFVTYDNSTPTSWLYFNGKWGDDRYASSDSRQVNFLGLGIEYKYDAGPTGPKDKQLNRTKVCPSNGFPCVVYPVAIA